jgi:hypothetical protein
VGRSVASELTSDITLDVNGHKFQLHKVQCFVGPFFPYLHGCHCVPQENVVFLTHKNRSSWHTCVVNFVVSSITMYNLWWRLVWHILHEDYNLTFECNIYHNKHHILCIVMDKTTKFTSHMCHELCEKTHILF